MYILTKFLVTAVKYSDHFDFLSWHRHRSRKRQNFWRGLFFLVQAVCDLEVILTNQAPKFGNRASFACRIHLEWVFIRKSLGCCILQHTCCIQVKNAAYWFFHWKLFKMDWKLLFQIIHDRNRQSFSNTPQKISAAAFCSIFAAYRPKCCIWVFSSKITLNGYKFMI